MANNTEILSMDKGLRPDQKEKAFEVARQLGSNAFKLRVVWFTDTKSFGLICTSIISGVVYDSANFLDDFHAKDHAEMFLSAFADALIEAEEIKKQSVLTIH